MKRVHAVPARDRIRARLGAVSAQISRLEHERAVLEMAWSALEPLHRRSRHGRHHG